MYGSAAASALDHLLATDWIGQQLPYLSHRLVGYTTINLHKLKAQ
jgi:hypothetical protein